MITTAARECAGAAVFTTFARGLEVREVFEFLVASINFSARQRAEAIHTKLLAAEAAHDRSVNDCAAQLATVLGVADTITRPLDDCSAHWDW